MSSTKDSFNVDRQNEKLVESATNKDISSPVFDAARPSHQDDLTFIFKKLETIEKKINSIEEKLESLPQSKYHNTPDKKLSDKEEMIRKQEMKTDSAAQSGKKEKKDKKEDHKRIYEQTKDELKRANDKISYLTDELSAKEKELKTLKDQEKEFSEQITAWKSKIHPGDQQKSTGLFDLSFFSKWWNASKTEIAKLKLELQEKDMTISTLRKQLREKEAYIVRLSGNKMDYLEKSGTVMDMSKDHTRTIMDKYKMFTTKTMYLFVQDFVKVLKDVPTIEKQIIGSYPHFQRSPLQLYCQFKITEALQTSYNKAKDILYNMFSKRVAEIANRVLNSQTCGSAEDDDYIQILIAIARQQNRVAYQVSLVHVTPVAKQQFHNIFTPTVLPQKDALPDEIIYTRQFMCRCIQKLTAAEVKGYVECIKEVFLQHIQEVTSTPLKNKFGDKSLEACKTVWLLITLSPPAIMFSGPRDVYNPRLHTVHPSAAIDPKTNEFLQQAESDCGSCQMPQIKAYATPIIFANNQGHVSVKGEVFL